MKYLLAALLSCFALSTAFAKDGIQIIDPRAKASVPGAMVSAAYLRITSPTAVKLMSVDSPAAGVTEMHAMALNDGVMRMHAVDAVDVPAGGSFEFKPGGYHIMLMQLKQPLKPGDKVPLVLTFEDAAKKKQVLHASALVIGDDAVAPRKP